MNDQEWISAEKPPNSNQEVLVIYLREEETEYGIGCHSKPNGWSIDVDVWDKVTHWMILPQKPKDL